MKHPPYENGLHWALASTIHYVIWYAFEDLTQNWRYANWSVVIGECIFACFDDKSHLSPIPFIRDDVFVKGMVDIGGIIDLMASMERMRGGKLG